MIDGGGGEAHGGAAAALAAAAAAAYGNKSFFQKNNKIENKEGNPTHRSRGPRRTHFKRESRAVITVRNSAATPGERVWKVRVGVCVCVCVCAPIAYI